MTSLVLISALALSACADENGGAEDPEAGDTEAVAADDTDNIDDDAADGDAEDDDEAEEAEPVEPSARETHQAGGPEPRLVVTYDGGVAVLDGVSTEVVGEFDVEGFVRVSQAGDGRHAFLAEGESFRLMDVGTWGAPHGDHNDYFTTDPLLTDVSVEGDTPARVVSHEGVGTLFFDGSDEYHWFDLEDLDAESEIETESAKSEGQHDGVAVVLEDGSRFETLKGSSGARFVDAAGDEVARNEDCPGADGEAAGPDGMMAIGCEDGVLMWDGDDFEKLETGEDYSRIGNLFSAEGSPIFLGDYRTDEDGEEPMTEVALVNTDSGEITTTSVDSPYNLRNLQRGPEGEALVLTEDGQLHIIDEETGEHLNHLQILDEWTEPEDWQEPSPTIRTSGDLLYVTDPEAQQIHIVDLSEGETLVTGDLDFMPNEFVVIDGRPIEGVSEEYDGDHGHDDEEGHGHEDDHGPDEDDDHHHEDDHDHHDH
ncbi:hypothetical protein [Nesterenkonia natronophila]|uniref:hypothetical protein n=1 Tax=Nesterenkonia natronophila TaxID=2174932 RepID=UPI001CEFAC4F|nr:hypothetical protein [Nesterenkonia natronophila]